MFAVVLYVVAIVVFIVLFHIYDSKEADIEQPLGEGVLPRPRAHTHFRISSIFAVLGLDISEVSDFQSFSDKFNSLAEVTEGCRLAGLESSNLIIGVDFSASNEWQGRKSLGGCCLHRLGSKTMNPYQQVIWIVGNALQSFDDDKLIPLYGFGDATVRDKDVFPFTDDDSPCHGFEEALALYRDVSKRINLGGPTSFAPIIRRAIEIVEYTQKYHILVIITDGQVTEENETSHAIVEASKYALSIIVVGVGDGPWSLMDDFDEHLPKRCFDNFNFVDFARATSCTKNPEASFALEALMEIPDQYKTIKSLGYLQHIPSKEKIQLRKSGSLRRRCQGVEPMVIEAACSESRSSVASSVAHIPAAVCSRGSSPTKVMLKPRKRFLFF